MIHSLKSGLCAVFVCILECAIGNAQSAATLYVFPPTTYAGGTILAGPYGVAPTGVTADAAGNLFGVDLYGGPPAATGPGAVPVCIPENCGEVYELINPGNSFQPWMRVTLWEFTGGADSCAPEGNLLMDATGALYGNQGGRGLYAPNGNEGGCPEGIFRLSRSKGVWNKQTLAGFEAQPDLAMDSNGNLFGVGGSVFELVAPANPNGVWNFDTLASVDLPTGGVRYFEGKLYGTTTVDNAIYGGVYEVTKAPGPRGTWTATEIASFDGGADGRMTADIYWEELGLTVAKTGEIFGVTSATVYELKKQSDGSWVKTNIYSFPQEIYAGSVVASADGKHLFVTEGGLVIELSAPTSDRTTWAAHTYTLPANYSGIEGDLQIDEEGLGIYVTPQKPSAVLDLRGLVPIVAPFRTLDEQGSACIQVSHREAGNVVQFTNRCARRVDFWYCAQAAAEGSQSCTPASGNLANFQTGYMSAAQSVAVTVATSAGLAPTGWAQSCDEGEYPALHTNKRGVQELTCGVPEE